MQLKLLLAMLVHHQFFLSHLRFARGNRQFVGKRNDVVVKSPSKVAA